MRFSHFAFPFFSFDTHTQTQMLLSDSFLRLKWTLFGKLFFMWLRQDKYNSSPKTSPIWTHSVCLQTS